jgi:hypothetical protein
MSDPTYPASDACECCGAKAPITELSYVRQLGWICLICVRGYYALVAPHLPELNSPNATEDSSRTLLRKLALEFFQSLKNDDAEE